MERLTTNHFVFLIAAVTLVSIIMYPSIFIESGGRDTWILTLVASIIILIYASIIFKVSHKTKSYDFKYICYEVLGKALGKVYLLLFSFIIIFTTVESASITISSINSNMFLETPIWYGLLFFIISGYFLAKKDLNSLVSVTIISMTLAIIGLILIFLLTNQYKDFKNLFPILQKGFNKELLLSTLGQIGTLSSFVILLPIIKHIDDKANLNKVSLKALVLLFLMAIWGTLGVIVSFGPIRGANMFYPAYIQCQMINYGGFLENGQIFLILFFILSYICKYILAIYSLCLLWNIKSKKIFIACLSIVIYLLSILATKNTLLLFTLLKYYQYLLFATLFCIPFLIYIIYSIKHKNKASKFQ